MVTKIDTKGVDFLISCEGFEPTMYICSAGKKTIGVGHVIKPGEEWMEDATLSYEEVHSLLAKDLEEFEKYTMNLFGKDLPQECFNACVSFVFNVGPGNAKKSLFLKYCKEFKWAKAVSALHNYGGDKAIKGLKIRRAKEAALFLNGISSSDG